MTYINAAITREVRYSFNNINLWRILDLSRLFDSSVTNLPSAKFYLTPFGFYCMVIFSFKYIQTKLIFYFY